MHTVKRSPDRPTLIDFNDWLKDKAEAHERMKTASGKVKGDETVSNTTTKTKTTSKVFAATTSTNQANAQVKSKPGNMPPNCVACKEKHPLWRCPVFRNKTPTERAKLVADNKLCFSCFRANHSFRECPSPANSLKKVVKAPTTHFFTVPNEFFRKKSETPNRKNPETSTCIGTTKTNDHVAESSGMPSVVDVKGLLQITEVELHSNERSERVLALCDSACSHSWISSRLADKLTIKGTATKLTVHGINCHQVVNTQMVELQLTPVHSGGSCSSFAIKPYVRDDLQVGTDVIDVESLKTINTI